MAGSAPATELMRTGSERWVTEPDFSSRPSIVTRAPCAAARPPGAVSTAMARFASAMNAKRRSASSSVTTPVTRTPAAGPNAAGFDLSQDRGDFVAIRRNSVRGARAARGDDVEERGDENQPPVRRRRHLPRRRSAGPQASHLIWFHSWVPVSRDKQEAKGSMQPSGIKRRCNSSRAAHALTECAPAAHQYVRIRTEACRTDPAGKRRFSRLRRPQRAARLPGARRRRRILQRIAGRRRRQA